MNFKLDYTGTEGSLEATLSCDGVFVASDYGFRDKKDVLKWADKAARDYKVNNTPEATHKHLVTGEKTFTL